MIIQIPFQGFYGSIHDEEFNHTIGGDLFTDWATGTENNDALSDKAEFDWTEVHKEYAELYVAEFGYRYDLNITFESLTSPREYNFETDRIFCHIAEESVLHMWRNTKLEILEKYIKQYCTSTSGFHSYYSNDFDEWSKNPLTYDHNQLMILCIAYLETGFDVEEGGADWPIREQFMCNGVFNEVLYKHCKNPRVFRVHNYLQERAARSET